MARWRSNSLAAYHGESNGIVAQSLSSSAVSRASSSAGPEISACSTEPSVERRSRGREPPWRSVSHRSGQSASVCRVDGLIVTVWSAPAHTGSAELIGAVPCQCPGSAPGTPAAANRANCVAASARWASVTAPGAAHTTARSRPTTAAGDNTGGAVIGPAAVSSVGSTVAHCASSARNGDGRETSSPLAPSTAVTSSRRRARPIAAISNRRSSASSGARADVSSPTPPSTSSSRWVPSTPPRGVVLGHRPSCRPAITTSSQSRPSAACGLSVATVSDPVVSSGRAGGSCRAATWSSRPGSDAPVVRAT